MQALQYTMVANNRGEKTYIFETTTQWIYIYIYLYYIDTNPADLLNFQQQILVTHFNTHQWN